MPLPKYSAGPPTALDARSWLQELEREYDCVVTVKWLWRPTSKDCPAGHLEVQVVFPDRGVLPTWALTHRDGVYRGKRKSADQALFDAAVTIWRLVDSHPQSKFWSRDA